MDVDDFAEGKVRMFEARMSDASPYVGVPLKDLEIPRQILIAMLFRRHKMIIPHGDDMLEPGDNVYFVGQQSAIKEFEETFVNTYEKIERVMIIGLDAPADFWLLCWKSRDCSLKLLKRIKTAVS